MKKKLLFLALTVFTLSIFSQSPSIATSLAVNADNTSATITFSEAVYKSDGVTQLTATELIPTIASGAATLSGFTVSTTDDTTFTFALTLAGTSNGAEVLTLDGTVYNSAAQNTVISTTVSFNDLTSPSIATALAVNANNTSATITFSEAVYKSDGSTRLTATELIPTIASGAATLSSFTVSTTDDTTFTFALTLAGSSNGAEVLTLDGTVYNSAAQNTVISTTVSFNDLTSPSIATALAVNANNTSATITFSEAVYKSDGSTRLTATELIPTIASGAATLSSFTVSTTDDTTFTLALTLAGTPNGAEILTLDGTVTDSAGNVSYQSTTVSFNDLTTADTTIPVITLTGGSTISSEVGATYTDAGATATDDIDGDITSSIVTGGTVDVTAVGAYTITYNVTDAAGNQAIELTRTVNIINDKIVTLNVSQTTITENETFTVNASINSVNSTDIIIDLTNVGSAKYSTDFTSNTPTRITTIAGIDGNGSSSKQLRNPQTIALDNAGNIYVGDSGNQRVQKFAPGATEGVTLISGVNGPNSIFIDTSGNIYLIQQYDHKVTKWASDGSYLGVVAGGNGEGSNANQLWNPQGVFVDVSGNVYVADRENHRVQKWAPGATEGITVAGGNGRGGDLNQLYNPAAIFVDQQENVYIADEAYGKIRKWAPGATEGVIVLENLNQPNDVFLDANGNMFVSERGEHRVSKYLPGSTSGVVVAGGNRGSGADQLNYPRKFAIDKGNIYVADTDNHRVQKYDISPQLVILAGETQASLLFSAIADSSDENDEIITLNTSVTNAVLASTGALTVNLTDINDPPSVTFVFNEENIKENSTTDVTLKATLSSTSGKAVEVIFTMEGTALETSDYILSSKTITIPANSAFGTLTISTSEIPVDGLVEALASIVFKVATITNATAVTDSATLFLESIENPTLTLSTSQESIAENETFNVTATLNAAASKDVTVSLESVGSAKYSADFTSNTLTRITTIAGIDGNGNSSKQFRNPYDVVIDNSGNLYVADRYNGRVQKFAPGVTEGVTLISGVDGPVGLFIDASGSVYVSEWESHKVTKWSATGVFERVVAGGNGEGTNANQLDDPQGVFVDVSGNVYVADRNNHRIQKWAPGATEGITVAGGNGRGGDLNQLYNPTAIFVDQQENVYIADEAYGKIRKWAPGATEGVIVLENLSQPNDVFLDANGNMFVSERGEHRVSKYLPGSTSGEVVAGGNRGSGADQLNYPRGFAIDDIGNIYVADTDNHRVQKYDISPQLVILAGETQASLLFSGIVDSGDENEEIITLNTSVTNAVLASTGALTVNLTDINDPPSVTFVFSEENIKENSTTDVTLKAILSSTSGKAVEVIFTMEGTASETSDYILSSKTITIPANSAFGTLTISTSEIPVDGLVEALASIVFKVATITNATAVTDSATLFLESIENPTLTLSTSQESIAENETFNVTATLNAAASKDVTVSLESVGSAQYSADFTSNSITVVTTIAGIDGRGDSPTQINYPLDVAIDNSGNLYVADINNGRVQKFAPGVTEGVTLISGVNNPSGLFIDASGSVYVSERQGYKVTKWSATGVFQGVVAGGNGEGSNANQLGEAQGVFVDATGNVYVADKNNHRIQKWAPGATEGITVAGGNGNGGDLNQLYNPVGIFVDQQENVYIADEAYGRIRKWAPGATEGVIVLENLSQPNDVFLDANGSMFVSERGEHRVSKYLPGSTSGEVVAGGARGSGADQLNYPRGFAIDDIGNIYVADTDNHRVQKYDISPQFVILAGETEASLLFSGIRDAADEVDEIITLNTSATNAVLASTGALTVNLTDINDPPSVTFVFSEENIKENSTTDVTLKAILSTTSGKAVEVIFTMEGTALETSDYILSSKTITIPANSPFGTLTISTSEIPVDGLVEALASIVFKVATITNATAVTDSATLFLESIENPTLTLSTSQESIAENETFNVTATLNAAASKDVTISLESVGSAKYNSDFTSNTPTRITTVAGGNGNGASSNQLRYPRGVYADNTGNLYVGDIDNQRVQKFAPGVTEGVTLMSGLSGPADISVDASGSIYVLEQYDNKVTKWASDGAFIGVVAGGNGAGSNANQLSDAHGMFVDAIGNIYIADSNNRRVQKWAPGATAGVTVAGGNGDGGNMNQFRYPRDVFVDELNNIYVADQWANRIQKWAPGSIQGETFQENLDSPIAIYGDSSGSIYVAEENGHTVKKFVVGLAGVEVFGSSQGNNLDQFSHPHGLFVDDIGVIYVGDRNNHRVQKYDASPQLVILAGETVAELLFSGIEDTRDENEEIITLNTKVTNAVQANTDALTAKLTDTTEEPTVILTLNQDKITENSITDVTLTASLSAVSGKDVTIVFTMSGTAEELVDYKLSSKTILIRANSPSGTITISTNNLDDAAVEVLASIVFNVVSITNATSLTDSATLLLESNDDPSVVLSTSRATIAEHETFNIIATLDAATSKDVVVGLKSIGTATYDKDFIRNSVIEIQTVAGGNGYGSAKNQIADPRGIHVTANGTVYVADYANERVQKWVPGAKEGQTVAEDLWELRDVFVDLSGNIYILYLDGRSVIKIPFGTDTGVSVAGDGGNPGAGPNQLNQAQSLIVDSEGNIFIADSGNYRIQKWAPGATEGVTVAGGNGEGGEGGEANQLNFIQNFAIDLDGNLLILDYQRRIQKWVPGADTGETMISYNEENNYNNSNPQDIHVDSQGNIFVLIESYDNNGNRQYSILNHDNVSYEAITVLAMNGKGSESNELDYARNFTFDALGNIYVSDNGNRRIQKYELSLQVKVKAGETSGALAIAGVEDELNDEGEELIVFTKTLASNAILNDTDELSVTLLDNRITMTLKDSPFLGLSEGAVSWGDYDKDGDKDVAVMGQSGSLGAVTILYQNNAGVFENTEQNFVNLFGGDITWVDLNKDGYIDLVVSGYDGVGKTPVTKVYINTIQGPSNVFIEPSEGYELPQLFSTKMAWGDLDNDGDLDLAISGQDAEDNFVFDVYFKDDITNNYTRDDGFVFRGSGFIKGDLKIVDRDLDGDNDIIYTGEDEYGNAVGSTIYNTYIIAENSNSYTPGLKNAAIEVAKMSSESDNISVLSSGEDNDNTIKLYLDGQDIGSNYDVFPLLKKGDIAIADFNNDGKNDILFTGENQSGVPVTKLLKQALEDPGAYNENYSFVDSGIELKGLRSSTANWVDYDMDGDLDLFLTGVGDSGAETLLYETEIENKKNTAPLKITGLRLVDLGNGNVRFNWDLPADDYATNLGYVIRVGTTPGGTELSNTESDLATGERLISKAPPIYNNFYDMQLDPGNYYWSVQAVDPGLRGGAFSDEDFFTLVYEWKILNQGGIVDRTVAGVNDPVIKLGDIDNDDDLDVIYGSKTNGNAQLLKYDGTQLIRDDNSPLRYVSNVTNTEVGDINGDGIADVLVNTVNGSDYSLNIYLSESNSENSSTNSGYNKQYVGAGLYNAKARIVDLNNDGQAEIFLVGMSSSSLSGIPKLYLYEYTISPANGEGYFTLNDVSDQIDALQYASYDLGDVDNDQDIDFIISGFSAESGFKTFVYENVTELGGEFTLEQTSNNLVAVKNGTTNFIDFDGDGDLDAVFTGESRDGDVFEIYMNTPNQGSATFSKLPNSLAPMREGKIDLGDFNGDGYADLLYSGTFSGSGDITKLNEYDANTKTYVDSAFDVSDIIKAEVEFGDLDGDGDLDFVIAGKSNDVNSDNVFRTYINVRNQSATVLAGKSSSKRPEYRGKNAAKYRSEQNFTVNSAPSAPVINDIVFLDEAEGSVDIPLEFSWNEATDDHTPNIGLTYALKIGTTPGGEEIMSSNSNANGVKKDAEKGNVEHNLKWKLSLPEGTYYWSVQAVDASYSGSIFSEPVQFRVTTSGIDTDSDGDGIENSLDTCPNTPAGDAVNDQGCSVNAILGDGNGDTTVNVTDLVVSVNYILGNNPTPFVFKAADVNNDDLIDVRDIVGIVDIILSETGDKSSESNKSTAFYSNTPIGDALFSWEGNDLYVSTDKEIAGMQLVFDKEFRYQVSESLASFNTLNFGEGSDNTLMIYSFSETSITPGKTKVLTKFEDGAVDLNIKKSAVGAKKGLTLAVKFTPVVPDQLEAFLLGPNPSSGQMNLFYNLPKEMDMLLLNVYNVNGSKVWSSDKIKTMVGAQTTPLNLSFLSNGVYFIRIEEYSKGVLKQNEVKRLIIKK